MSRHFRLISAAARSAAVPWVGVLYLAIAAPPLAADAARQSSIGVVRIGHWVEIRGTLAPDGSFVGEQAELLQPQSEGVLIGTVPADERDPRHFRLLGRTITTDAKTRWHGLAPGAIAGARVKVEGEPSVDGSLAASTVSTRGEGRDRIGGRIDELRQGESGPIARILGFEVRLPTAIEHEEPLEAIADAPTGRPERLSTARDEDDLFGEGVALGSTMRLTGQLELDGSTEQELDLDATVDEDRELAEASARLRLDWRPPGGRIWGAVEGRGTAARSFEPAGDRSTSRARLGETYLAFADLVGAGSDLVVGRQDFDDEREWIYDQNLDGARVFLAGRRVRFELSASTTVSDGSPRDEAATNFVAYLSNSDRKRRLAAWVMHREFDLAVAERTTHVGVRATGRWLAASESWLDLALFRGKRGAIDLEGWALDVGATARPDWLQPFSFTVGFAQGSGGTISAEKDATFRQTGFQDNNGKFAGVTSFRYYGELVDPELANLRVVTAGVGMRFARRSSLDLVWHAYQQDTARQRLIDTELDRRADGKHTGLGWEADLVFGSRESPLFDLEVVAAYFSPGAAFPADAEAAFLGRIQMRFRF